MNNAISKRFNNEIPITKRVTLGYKTLESGGTAIKQLNNLYPRIMYLTSSIPTAKSE
ncbi:MAG: hypothetical protein AB8B69_01335 [Chitinophagales bacterium]